MKLFECTSQKPCDKKEKQIEGKGGLVLFLCNWEGYCNKQARDKPKKKRRNL